MDKLKLTIQTKFDENDFENGIIKPFSVFQKFQKVAVLHAKNVGVGFEDMLKQNLLWVTLRTKFKILSMPKPNEEVFVSTFASNRSMLEFDRDFIIENQTERLIEATSKWCLIDKDSRKIARLNILSPLDNLILPQTFTEKFLKTESFETDDMKPILEYIVEIDDIDKNNHMNNTIYTKIIQNTNQIKNTYKFFQINFLREVFLNDKIFVYSKKIDDKILFVGKLENGEISFSAMINELKK